MPEEESEDETNAKSHKPGDKEEWTTLQVSKLLQNCDPLRDFSCCLCKHLCL